MARAVTTDATWAGTEASFLEYMNAQESIIAKMTAGPMEDDDEEDGCPYLLSVEEGVATLSITGSLTNRESPWNQFFGITSYGAIREAMVYAASDPEIKHIMLDINSGGGAVNGVADTANLIRLVNDKVKPVTAYTDGSMCSAAYWLGCSAGEVYSSNIATVGSIGVIATHMEYSKQLKEDGIGVTVMRSGKYKALVNSVEPLTEAAKEQMQSQLDTVYGIFVDHVAAMTDRPRDYVEANMAQGREFLGEQAKNAGLVDGISTYDELMSEIRTNLLDNQTHSYENPRNLAQGAIMNKKKALTEQEIAALAEGGAATQASSPAAPAAGNPENILDGDGVTDAAPVEGAVEAPVTEGAAATQAASPAVDVVTFLQGQVKEKDAQLIANGIEISGLKAKVSEMEASFSGLKEIAAKSINNMKVALSMPSVDLKESSATDILAMHKSMIEPFQSQFKAGGVAAVDAAEASKGDVKSVDPLHFARLAAVVPTAPAK